jgi:hypothetical protein
MSDDTKNKTSPPPKLVIDKDIDLHSTCAPDTYYTDLDKFPKEIRHAILDGEVEVESSSYTVGDYVGFLRGEIEIHGKLYDYEISVYSGSSEQITSGYEVDWDNNTVKVNDEDIDIDEYCEERCLSNTNELLSYGDDSGYTIYLEFQEELLGPKCIYCTEELTKPEYLDHAEEFRPYPSHDDCFDTFENAEEFLRWAYKKKIDQGE